MSDGENMPVDFDRVETVTYDSFTTIVDVHRSTREALMPHIDDPEPVANVWRFRAVEYRMMSNFVDHYETYEESTKHALEYALAVNGVELAPETVDEIVAVFRDLHVFDDVRESMERIEDAGYDQYIVSNGNPEVLDAMVSKAEIGDLIEDTVSANEIRTYKPEVEFYKHVSERVSTPLEEIVHVATPWYDVFGAMNAGMQAAWVNRKGKPWETYDGDPDLVVDSMAEFADQVE